MDDEVVSELGLLRVVRRGEGFVVQEGWSQARGWQDCSLVVLSPDTARTIMRAYAEDGL